MVTTLSAHAVNMGNKTGAREVQDYITSRRSGSLRSASHRHGSRESGLSLHGRRLDRRTVRTWLLRLCLCVCVSVWFLWTLSTMLTLSVCLFVCLFACLSVCLSVYLSVPVSLLCYFAVLSVLLCLSSGTI